MGTIFLLAIAIIFVMDEIPLIRNKQWKDLTVSIGIMAVAGALLAGRYAGMTAPLKLLDGLLEGLGKKWFG